MAPATHRAVTVQITGETKVLVVQEKSLPVLSDDDVLIKVKAVTLNP